MILPKQEILDEAYVKDYEALYKESIANPEAFWEKIAKELFWFKPWNKVLEWNYPYARWFTGGQTNIVYNALDRHLTTPTKDKLAIIWEGQPFDVAQGKPSSAEISAGKDAPARTFTYQQLNDEVCRFANALKSMGLKKGDHVSIYLPRIPEQDIAMLACAKIGLVHSVVFSGFSIEALKNRVIDAQSKVIICTNAYPYKDKVIESKKNVDEAVKDTPTVQKVIVIKRLETATLMQEGRDVWWDKLVVNQSTDCATEIMEATDPLYILYTSGCCHKNMLIQLSTGEIKRIEDLVEQKGTKVINVNLDTLEEENDEIVAKYHYREEPHLIQIKTPISSGLFTSNHPFFVLQDDGEIFEKEAQHLKVGEHVMMTKKIEFTGVLQQLPTPHIIYHEEKCTKNLPNKPKLPRYLSSDFAELLGVFLGDGCLRAGYVDITDKDVNNLILYKNLIEKLGLRAQIKKYDRQRVIINSRFFAQYLKEVFPEIFTSSHQRDIPTLIQKSEEKIIAAFIRGIYDAEGSIVIKSSSVKILSTSKALIQKLQLLLLRFSVVTSYCEELRKTHFGKKQYITNVYELRITDRESLQQFGKEIGFSSIAKKEKLKTLLNVLDKKRIASMIYFLPLNSLLKKIRQTIRLRKKESREVFLYSYEYGKRRVTLKHLPNIIDYTQKLIKEIDAIDLRNISSKRKAIFLFRISEKTLAEISKKSVHTVHKYLHANKQGVSQITLSKFTQTIIPYLEETKKEKIYMLFEILERIKKLESLKNVGFFEVKKISVEKNDDDFDSVYDITTEKNHNYIANGFIVHNSTGKPKGVVHDHGGYMVGTYITLKWVFNLQQDDIYFCTADAGWVTGHSYIVYSPLINGITTFIYEGTPDYPDPGKWWELVQKYKITKFYTAPTAIRALMRLGEEWPKKYDLSSLKILGSVGEPINPEAWLWYYKNIGRERCPVMDTWWQTETGMFMLTPLPSVPLKPGSCFKPFLGIVADLVNEKGESVPPNTQGFLVIKTPWPAMLMDVYNNPKKYLETYFENESLTRPVDKQFFYFAGDSAKKDEDGYFWIIGRNDDVIKVSGHRLGSAELESAFVSHPSVAEAAAIGKPHEVKGESIKVFVILKQGIQPSEQLKEELKQQVRKMIGPIATPDEIDFVDKLPKTRSGKIMRRVLKAQELGLPIGDTSTLEQ